MCTHTYVPVKWLGACIMTLCVHVFHMFLFVTGWLYCYVYTYVPVKWLGACILLCVHVCSC